jgi:hypothetical protein
MHGNKTFVYACIKNGISAVGNADRNKIKRLKILAELIVD